VVIAGATAPLLVVLALLGLVGGIGITAIGPGGVLPTIGLFALTDLSPAAVAGTAIVTHVATGVLGTTAFARSGQLRESKTRRMALLLAGTAVIGTPFGVLINTAVSKRVFGLVLGDRRWATARSRRAWSRARVAASTVGRVGVWPAATRAIAARRGAVSQTRATGTSSAMRSAVGRCRPSAGAPPRAPTAAVPASAAAARVWSVLTAAHDAARLARGQTPRPDAALRGARDVAVERWSNDSGSARRERQWLAQPLVDGQWVAIEVARALLRRLDHRPTAPSIRSRMMSAWPVWRPVSSIMWTRVQRMVGANP